MGVQVRIPAPLRTLAGGQDKIELDCITVAECLDRLEARFQGMKQQICDETGELHRFVNIYVNGEDIRFLQGLATPLKAGDEITIMPAVAGG